MLVRVLRQTFAIAKAFIPGAIRMWDLLFLFRFTTALCLTMDRYSVARIISGFFIEITHHFNPNAIVHCTSFNRDSAEESTTLWEIQVTNFFSSRWTSILFATAHLHVCEASYICTECEDALCSRCSAQIHRVGARQNHTLFGLRKVGQKCQVKQGELDEERI